MNDLKTDAPKANLLVVDDTPVNLQLLSKILTKQGYFATTASSGPTALNTVQTKPPDLILLDVMMPDMDGYEVCKQLKAEARTRDIPIIFLSASHQTQDKVKAFAVGGVDYITKPFQSAEVWARVETHLALRHLQKHLQEKNDQLYNEIVERRKAETALQQSNNRYSNLAQSIPESMGWNQKPWWRMVCLSTRMFILMIATRWKNPLRPRLINQIVGIMFGALLSPSR